MVVSKTKFCLPSLSTKFCRCSIKVWILPNEISDLWHPLDFPLNEIRSEFWSQCELCNHSPVWIQCYCYYQHCEPLSLKFGSPLTHEIGTQCWSVDGVSLSLFYSNAQSFIFLSFYYSREVYLTSDFLNKPNLIACIQSFVYSSSGFFQFLIAPSLTCLSCRWINVSVKKTNVSSRGPLKLVRCSQV